MTPIWFAIHKSDRLTIQISSQSYLNYRLNWKIYLSRFDARLCDDDTAEVDQPTGGQAC
jgi:hypothetical protein